ncbi:MAG: CapA family protein, partial [Desulfocucumaceae bacterium]
CRFIVAYMHFGTEYQRHPNEFQRTLARELFDAGADVVVGSHPHVVQPLEWQGRVLDGRQKKVLAAYSLGNFISNQRWRYSDCGMILNLDILKNDDGTASLEGASYVPVWVHTYTKDGVKKYRVLPVREALKNYEAKSDPLLTGADYLSLQQVWQDTTALMGPGFYPGP